MHMQKENPIARQSKQWLADALFGLMDEKPYEKITIQEIAQRAELDRKTFYRHFRSKEEVLQLRLEEACQQYVHALQALPQLTSYAVTEAYFSVCLAHLPLFDALNRNGLLALALFQFDAYLPELNELFLSNPAYRGKSNYELFYQAGGFWNVTVQWLNHGAKESPAEMARIISSIMPPTLRTET